MGAVWALHAAINSSKVRAEAVAAGGVRSRAIRDAADQGWFDLVLKELLRFGVVAPRECAIEFLGLAKHIVAGALKMNIVELDDSLDLSVADDHPRHALAVISSR